MPVYVAKLKPATLLTAKQTALLTIIAQGNPDGSEVDLDQVLERLPYKTTKHSLQFSIRIMVAKGLIEKLELEGRRSRWRCVIKPTKLGLEVYGKKAPAASMRARPNKKDLEKEARGAEGLKVEPPAQISTGDDLEIPVDSEELDEFNRGLVSPLLIDQVFNK